MVCSAVTLSIATICAVAATALIAIAFGTDNWKYIDVDRRILQKELQNSADAVFQEQFESNEIYYSRTKGLFRICFPEEKPRGVDVYLSPVETYCRNIEYYIPDEKNQIRKFSDDLQTALRMGHSVIGLIIVAFFFIFVAFWTGVSGCWRRSTSNITSTGILILLACLFASGGMGLWHGVEYFEKEKIQEPNYYLSYPQLLKNHTRTSYDWSYVLAWIGIGFSLVSSFLFFGASHCLHNEKEQEHAHKMHYQIPMYPPQKSQYPYSYGYGFPGPYYYGSQYGPYNY